MMVVLTQGQGRYRPSDIEEEIKSLENAGSVKKFCSKELDAIMRVLCFKQSDGDDNLREKKSSEELLCFDSFVAY